MSNQQSVQFHASALKPKVTKLGQGEELIEFANGDEFAGTTFVACTWTVYSGVLRNTNRFASESRRGRPRTATKGGRNTTREQERRKHKSRI